MSDVFIIAEAGVNHNGREELAFQLIDAAINAGANAVKFQTFKSDQVVTKTAKKAGYQRRETGGGESQYEMLKKLELAHDSYKKLADYCEEKGIQFLSTAFDYESLDFLVNKLGLKTLKIPSGEITNAPFLIRHAELADKLIVSTGMATLEEVEEALGVIAYGFLSNEDGYSEISPSPAAFRQAYLSDVGKKMLKEKVTLLHCTTEYPTPFEDVNLKAMQTMYSTFGLNIGCSDHSQGVVVPIAATALGATVIEKHFTLDKSLEGPDHKASLNPEELKAMVDGIRSTQKALGNGIKEPQPSELKNRDVARRSLVAGENIQKGEVFTVENITIKRPGHGLSPMKYWDYLGKVSDVNYVKEELLRED
jgi:N-acetylneuraminate synthase